MAITSFATASSGSNDFSISVGSTGNTTYILDRAYPAGSYKVSVANGDTTYDIYAVAKNGTYAGYTRSATLITTAEFNQMSILGAAANEILSFQYNGAYSTPSTAGDVSVAGAYITSISDSTLVNANDSTVVTGGNFAMDVAVTFTGTDSIVRDAKTVIRSSSTSLTATRPDTMPVSASPYSVAVSNPGIPTPSSSSAHILSNSVTAGGTPTWVTGTTLPGYVAGTAYSTTVSATDADGTVTYALVSGGLPTGITIDSSTGVISGTSSESTEFSPVIRATDAGGNFIDRTFSLPALTVVSGGTLASDATYYYRTFTSNGTFAVSGPAITADILMVAGGGGAGRIGGGGAGGLVYSATQTLSASNYSVVVGAGGAAQTLGGGAYGGQGGSTTFTGRTTAVGGGGGASGDYQGGPGGSGGGAGGSGFIGGAGTAGQGNAGGNGSSSIWGGGGGAGAAGSSFNAGNGVNTYSSWATVTGTGASGYYAGGGAGRNNVTGVAGTPGLGGGGTNVQPNSTPGAANTGGGGGGGATIASNGGSGIVIVRYARSRVGG